MPQVSVIIPTYQRTQLLERAVRSVISQQGEISYELIVVDDGSEEGVRRTNASLREELERRGVRWIQLEKNGGVAAARNTGAADATGDWIAFLDSDDVWGSDKLRAQLRFHGENPHFLVSQSTERWVRDGKAIRRPKHWQQRSGDLFAQAVERCSIGPSCVMIACEVWDELGGFDPRFRVCEDYELWLRLTARYQVGLVPDSSPAGDASVEKHAGHEGQLSIETPAMDRWRLLALQKATTQQGYFGKRQTGMIRAALRQKAEILQKGAEKRGLLRDASHYAQIGSTVPREVLAWLRNQCYNL